MSLLTLIIVFLLEQVLPLPYRRLVERPLAVLADWVEARLNAGAARHGVLAWVVLVLPLLLLCLSAYAVLYALNPLLALALNVVVLYFTMGFRQFSHHYTEIQMALRLGEVDRARDLLGEWLGRPVGPLGASEIARLSIESALAASHRHVFAVLLWFVLLPGPVGAVLYRLSALLAERWGGREDAFGRFAGQVFTLVNWLPVRGTAAGFAVVGDFEDAVYCWRTQAAGWNDPEMGIVLASGAGALGVQLGMPVYLEADAGESSELGLGQPADVDFMQSAVGLVWRATVLWILLLFLLGVASLVS